MSQRIEGEFPKPIIIDQRRIGNTTRLIDYYIQVLFKDWKVQVLDHHPAGNIPHGGGMTYIMRTLVQRLQNEHRMNNKDFTIQGNTIIINDPSKLYR